MLMPRRGYLLFKMGTVIVYARRGYLLLPKWMLLLLMPPIVAYIVVACDHFVLPTSKWY
jgi:hypothetical protein